MAAEKGTGPICRTPALRVHRTHWTCPLFRRRNSGSEYWGRDTSDSPRSSRGPYRQRENATRYCRHLLVQSFRSAAMVWSRRGRFTKGQHRVCSVDCREKGRNQPEIAFGRSKMPLPAYPTARYSPHPSGCRNLLRTCCVLAAYLLRSCCVLDGNCCVLDVDRFFYSVENRVRAPWGCRTWHRPVDVLRRVRTVP